MQRRASCGGRHCRASLKASKKTATPISGLNIRAASAAGQSTLSCSRSSDYGILDFSSIVLPSTTNFPFP